MILRVTIRDRLPWSRSITAECEFEAMKEALGKARAFFKQAVSTLPDTQCPKRKNGHYNPYPPPLSLARDYFFLQINKISGSISVMYHK